MYNVYIAVNYDYVQNFTGNMLMQPNICISLYLGICDNNVTIELWKI